MTFTVRELAEELGVSKQAIHKKINQLPPKLTPKKVDGAYQLTEEIAEAIRDSVKMVSTDNQPVDGEVDALKMMIKELKEEKSKLYDQLEKKDMQLSQLQKLVDQQQQLTLQANRQNERLQLQLQFFQEKDDEVEEAIDDSSEQKKWWHFWTKGN